MGEVKKRARWMHRRVSRVVELDDLTAQGYLGLCVADKRWKEPAPPFEAFAMSWAVGQMYHFVRDNRHRGMTHLARKNASVEYVDADESPANLSVLDLILHAEQEYRTRELAREAFKLTYPDARCAGVLRMRHLEAATFKAIGEAYGMGKSRADQIDRIALSHAREQLAERHL